jgi:hypothetical protein
MHAVQVLHDVTFRVVYFCYEPTTDLLGRLIVA